MCWNPWTVIPQRKTVLQYYSNHEIQSSEQSKKSTPAQNQESINSNIKVCNRSELENIAGDKIDKFILVVYYL